MDEIDWIEEEEKDMQKRSATATASAEQSEWNNKVRYMIRI